MRYRLVKETIGDTSHYFTEREDEMFSDVWTYVSESITHDEAIARKLFEKLVATGSVSDREVVAEAEGKAGKDVPLQH